MSRIYTGYQGVGKSTLAKNHSDKFIDLESSLLFIEDKRPEGWEEQYVNIAVALSNQGHSVLLSSHKSVRDELKKRNIEFISIYPALELKDEWIKRLEDRYNENPTEKNFKALANAKEKYEDNIMDLSDEDMTLEIQEMKYDLYDYMLNCNLLFPYF